MARRRLLLAHHGDEGNLLEPGVTDLAVQALGSSVNLDANARRAEPGAYLLRVVVELVFGRSHNHLRRMEPRRKSPGVALDQVAEETLHRPGRAAVDHDRPLARPVFGHVLEVETLWELEVHLDGRVGELAAVRVADLEVDLRPVERRVPHSARVGLA